MITITSQPAMIKRDHRAYVHYYFDHPEEFNDRPPLGVSSALWIRKIQEGEVTLEEVNKVAQRLRDTWKNYHQSKAEALRFDINLERLENDLSWLAIEFRLAADDG